MVLIVVLSVHAGFERNLKEILLGYSPHVTVQSRLGGVENWEEMEKGLESEPGVKSAYAVVEGYVLLDTPMWRRPVGFRAFNTENEGQVKALEDYPPIGERFTIGEGEFGACIGVVDEELHERGYFSRISTS